MTTVHAATGGKLAYTYAEAAELLGVSARTVWSMVAAGTLRAVRIGRAVRIPATELARYLAQSGGAA